VTEVKRIYPTVSLENTELFDAQSLLFSGIPGDLAFGEIYVFKELLNLSV
jgi:hypothetical protein